MPSTTLASLTTLRLGGPANDVLQVADPDDWFELVRTIGDRQGDAPSPSVMAATSSPPTPATRAPSP